MSENQSSTGILFVCLGNICRSPMAEAIFHRKVQQDGLLDQFYIDSAGIGSWHLGELADKRTRKIGEQFGLNIEHRARQFKPSDLQNFDFILNMELPVQQHIENLQRTRQVKASMMLMRSFDPDTTELDVPDPYRYGEDAFVEMYHLLDKCCSNFLEYVKKQA